MRTLAICAAALQLSMMIYFIYEKGFPHYGHDEFYLVLVATVAPILTLAAAKWDFVFGDNIISLYIKRKILEEKKRIKFLQRDE